MEFSDNEAIHNSRVFANKLNNSLTEFEESFEQEEAEQMSGVM